jgi:hypothetical protein
VTKRWRDLFLDLTIIIIDYSKMDNNQDEKFIYNITDKLDECRMNLNEILRNIFKQEVKIKEIKNDSSELKENTFNIKKTILRMNNFIYYFFDNSKKEFIMKNKKSKIHQNDEFTRNKIHQNDEFTRNKIHQNDEFTINEDLSYKNKSNLDLLLNEILPSIKENAKKINSSLDRQLKEVDSMDDNVHDSIDNIRKLNKKI